MTPSEELKGRSRRRTWLYRIATSLGLAALAASPAAVPSAATAGR